MSPTERQANIESLRLKVRQIVLDSIGRALQEARPDRTRVESAFREHLALLKLPQRPVIFYPNFVEVCGAIGTHARDVAWDAAWNAKMESTWDTAWKGGQNDEWNAAQDAAWNGTWANAWESAMMAAWGGARADAWESARMAVWDTARAVAWDAATSSTKSNPLASFIPFLEALRGGLLVFWVTPAAVHVALATVRSQESRLHSPDSPAVEYEDHSGVYAWRGVLVPEYVITRPEDITPTGILGERNAEVRRVMIERYGQDRFVLDAGARTLDREGDNELLAIDLPDDPDHRLVALKLRCPSTSAVYIVRVPPDQKTVRSALAWSFGLERAEDYHLQAES